MYLNQAILFRSWCNNLGDLATSLFVYCTCKRVLDKIFVKALSDITLMNCVSYRSRFARQKTPWYTSVALCKDFIYIPFVMRQVLIISLFSILWQEIYETPITWYVAALPVRHTCCADWMDGTAVPIVIITIQTTLLNLSHLLMIWVLPYIPVVIHIGFVVLYCGWYKSIIPIFFSLTSITPRAITRFLP